MSSRKVEYTVQQILALYALRDLVISAGVLAAPHPAAPFRITTDGSAIAVGGQISQIIDGEERTVAFYSRKCRGPEQSYPAHELELLAIVSILKAFGWLLQGRPFVIYTDHRPLQHFMQQNNLSNKQVRWMEWLSRFDFTLEYIPGKYNIVADYLSRHPQLNATEFELDYPIGNYDINADYLSINPQFNALFTKLKSNPLPEFIKEALLDDPYGAERIAMQVQSDALRDGLLFVGGKIYVPETLRGKVIYEFHDAPTGGHLGRDRTLSGIQQLYWWPGMRKTVESYIRTCDVCQRTKASTLKPPGLLHPIAPPYRNWQIISMDFITGLPRTARGYDSILTVVDTFSKMVHFIPCRSDVTAKQVARLFVDNIFRYHGLPEGIISDRDPKFTSDFWTELFGILGTKLQMSTAYHAQTDGQSERSNRVIEEILRAYVNVLQSDWDLYLSVGEFSYNNTVHKATKEAPFMVNLGFNPRTPATVCYDQVTDKSVKEFLETLQLAQDVTRQNIIKAQSAAKARYDKSHRNVQLNVGDLVMLSTANVRATNEKQKLSYLWVGPFKVLKKVNDLSYQLDLPAHWRIHDTFHVSLLKPYFDGKRIERPVRLQARKIITLLNAF